ncbi:MAG TPA: DNA-formamidopyrimidine glycosylase family protein [Actinomycetales bacterium]|nr:DNA-formamidopyrimidine glycosylase family protein [Actinomycetales bacterium]
MPEGDVVWRTAHRLHDAFAGQRLTVCDLRWPGRSTIDLTGRTVLEVVPRGKHLLMRLDGDPRLTLHSHLRMDGSWRLQPADRPLPPVGPRDDVRAVLGTPAWTAVGRLLGMLDVVRTQDEGTLVGHLGPDVLGPDWDPATVEITLSRQPSRAIGEALLDQQVLAGVGTFYMAEALYLRGVSPWTPAGEVRDVPALLGLLHRLLLANRDRVGQVTTGDTRPGRTSYVHGRARRACRRCGTPIQVAPIGSSPHERVAFFCPTCQPGPAPPRTAGGGRRSTRR